MYMFMKIIAIRYFLKGREKFLRMKISRYKFVLLQAIEMREVFFSCQCG